MTVSFYFYFFSLFFIIICCFCLVLSDEQVTKLRQILHEAGLGKQGRSRSPASNATALLQVNAIQQLGHSYDASVKATAAAHLTSPHTIRSVMKEFQSTNTVPIPDNSHRGRGNPNHPFYHETGPTLEVELFIHQRLHDVQLNNVFESCRSLCEEVKEQFNVVVSHSTMNRWLHALGYQYGKKHFVHQPSAYRYALIRKHIYKYAQALKEQEAGQAILVYMDESYIYSKHCPLRLWYSLASARKNHIRGENKGKRIIIMHAMTKDGLLEVEGVEPSNILTELYHSCALIFDEVCKDDITPADYHDTINGEKFIAWIQTRLLPTFRAKYGNTMKMYLVLDNAKYHHHRGPDWFSATNKTKGQLADFLRQRGVKQITLDDGRIIKSNKFSADCRGRNGGGATIEQLKIAVKQHLSQHPEINTTVPQQLFDDAGYELLYTPPYVSELQPIELIWAYTKSIVAHLSHRNRTTQEAAVQTRQAMEQVTKELCQDVINHSHKFIDAFMQSEEGGNLRQFGSLQQLISFPLIDHIQTLSEAESLPTTTTTTATDDANENRNNNKPQWNSSHASSSSIPPIT